jgi:hypothetical protein
VSTESNERTRCCWEGCWRTSARTTERGLPRGISVDAIDDLGAFGSVLDAIRDLYRDPAGYETLVIDTLDALEPMLLEHVCAQHGWKNIESPSFGKGWVLADAA